MVSVLYVEYDTTLRQEILFKHLMPAGYSVMPRVFCADALQEFYIKPNRFQIIIADNPDFIKKIREKNPTVLIIGLATPDAEKSLIDSGANCFLSKDNKDNLTKIMKEKYVVID